jgi:hypothetical protein
MLRAVATQKAPVLLAASAATGMSVTGTTNETALATVSIPAGSMGTSGGLHVYTTWTMTNSANSKTPRIRLGGIAGTAFMAVGFTTAASFADFRRIKNRGAANSQVAAAPAAASSPFGASSSAVTAGAVDTSAAQDLVISGQLTNTGETLTLESYEVWLIP